MSYRIRETRKNKNLTLEALGKLIDKKKNTVSRYENELIEPNLETWKKLSDVLGVPVPYLQGISDNPSGKTNPADFSRWDHDLEKSQADQAKMILDAISPDNLASLDFEECSNRLGILNEALTFMKSNPKQAFDLWTLLILLNGNDELDTPTPNISDDFKQQVLEALS